ncbi:MAG TPA: ABC transporter permease [Gemmatimonadaceae bacterium]|nr:ABC transporter permease [Gemmatimonadaceae bacterium]
MKRTLRLSTLSVAVMPGAVVSSEFFTASGVRPLLGRFFTPNEYETVVQRVAVISDDLWRRRFNAAANLIGTRIQLDGQPVYVVGVATRVQVADPRRGMAAEGSAVASR